MTSSLTTAAAASRRVAVMGSGSWGTAFGLVLSDAGNAVTLWARRPELADQITREHRNPDYAPGIALPESLCAVSDPEEAMAAAEFVVLAVPSQSLRANLSHWPIPRDAVVVSLAKGIELGTGLRMSQVIAEAGDIAAERIAVVTGPNLAREIAERQPSASVVASSSEETAAALQQVCHTARFRAYTNTDVVGCELGGATKNVIALAVGMVVGLGLGANATASVITRGLAEITRLGQALGADPYTFSGLAGLGDLVATCSSPLSRNRTFGEELGRGRTVAEITASTRQVAEGVLSCASIQALAAQHQVEMPIVENVAAVIAGDLTPEGLITTLMARSAKPERY
jgi:glycerol-3-phosphate dehydrogenase (NAD(P)+)